MTETSIILIGLFRHFLYQCKPFSKLDKECLGYLVLDYGGNVAVQLQGFNSSGQRFLSDRQYCRLALSDVCYAPGLNLANHAHERGKICLVVQGKYHERIGHQTIHYRPFHCVYHPPGFDHTDGVGENGMRLLSLSFDKTLFDEIDTQRVDLTPLREMTGRSQVWKIVRLFTASPSLLPIEIEAAAVNIVTEVVAAATKIPRSRQSLRAARDFVIENYRSNVTLAEVAQAVDLHPVYLGQLFTREARQTLGDFVNDLRVRAAAEALLCGSFPLADIALENGFYDQSHFSRVFSRKVGVSPGVFRRRYQTPVAGLPQSRA
jgi:AraC family transcriptional regulator